jgi:pimeloyl-ACP methyl ester carboxylesterase
MRKLARWLVGLLLLSLVLLLLGVRRDLPAAEVEARYAVAPSQFISVDGMRVHYRDRGTGPAVVLLHGSNSSLFTWEGWVAALSPEHRVITLDLPGHGLTGPHPEARYSFADMAEFVDHFVAALRLERFSLAGNSMGGAVAWHYALRHPEKLDKLILIDAYAYPQPAPAMLKLFALPGVGQVTRWVSPRFAVAKTVRDVYGDPSRVTDDGIERYYELLLRDGNREATRLRLSGGGDDGLSARLPEIPTPTLILWGTRDRWIAPANGDRLAHDIPGARLITFDGLGHMPMEEDPQRTVAPVLTFLR